MGVTASQFAGRLKEFESTAGGSSLSLAWTWSVAGASSDFQWIKFPLACDGSQMSTNEYPPSFPSRAVSVAALEPLGKARSKGDHVVAALQRRYTLRKPF